MLDRFIAKLDVDSHVKEMLAGSSLTFLIKTFGMFLGYLAIFIISQRYGAAGVGIYNLTLSMMMFVAMLSMMGMNVSILRYVGQLNKSGEEFRLRKLYKYVIELVVPFSLFLSLLLYTSANFIALKVLQDQVFQPAIEFVAFIIPLLALQNISVEFIRGLKKLKVSEFFRSVSRPSINIVLLLSLSWYFIDQLLPIYTLGAGVVLSAICALIFIIRNLKSSGLKSSESINKDVITKKELISTSLPMMITVVASFVMGNISLYLLEGYSSTEHVGIFSVALKIAALVGLVLVIVNTISAPKFSELYWSNEYGKLQNLISHSTGLIFIISLCVSLLIIVFSKPILSIFGEEFIVGSVTLILLVIGQMINAMTGSVGVLLNMTGNQKTFRSITVLAMMVNIILNVLLVPLYGMNGAAVAITTGLIILNTGAAIATKRKLGLTTYPKLQFRNKYGK